MIARALESQDLPLVEQALWALSNAILDSKQLSMEFGRNTSAIKVIHDLLDRDLKPSLVETAGLVLDSFCRHKAVPYDKVALVIYSGRWLLK